MNKKLTYFFAVYKNSEGMGYWGHFADFHSAATQGDTLDELVDNANEFINAIVEDAVKHNRELPLPASGDAVKKKLDKEDGELFCLIPIVVYPPAKTVKANITVKGNLLAQFDHYAEKHNLNRSRFMTAAAIEYIRNNP